MRIRGKSTTDKFNGVLLCSRGEGYRLIRKVSVRTFTLILDGKFGLKKKSPEGL